MNSSIEHATSSHDDMQRKARVADLMASCHAQLRDRYAGRALVLDLAILLVTLWVTALAFVDPHIASALSPDRIGKEIWIGTLGVFAFALSLVQLRVDWKSRADQHGSACKRFSRVKQLINDAERAGVKQLIQTAEDEFNRAAAEAIAIPE